MLIGPPYWIRMVYLKNGKWSAVCLIEYVWSNIFQLTAPAYVLMSMCGLFGTEEYYFTWLNLQRAVLKCTDKMIRLDKNVEKQEAEELHG